MLCLRYEVELDPNLEQGDFPGFRGHDLLNPGCASLEIPTMTIGDDPYNCPNGCSARWAMRSVGESVTLSRSRSASAQVEPDWACTQSSGVARSSCYGLLSGPRTIPHGWQPYRSVGLDPQPLTETRKRFREKPGSLENTGFSNSTNSFRSD